MIVLGWMLFAVQVLFAIVSITHKEEHVRLTGVAIFGITAAWIFRMLV